MSNRSKSEAQAIGESIGRPEQKVQPKKRQSEGAGSDLDRELGLYFSGGFKSDAGLHSGLGSAGNGGGAGNMGDPPHSVELGIAGPSRYSDAWRVTSALEVIANLQVRVTPEANLEGDTGKDFHVPAIQVLRGYYTPHPPWRFSGLVDLQPMQAVSLLTPAAQRVTRAWMDEQCRLDLAATEKAVKEASKEAAGRLDVARDVARRRNSDASKKKLKKLESCAQTLDPIGDVRRKWARPPLESDGIAALRALCGLANGGKETVERRRAKLTIKGILRQARPAWTEARKFYGYARRDIDRELRARPKAVAKADVAAYLARFEPLIPADQD